MAERRPKLLFDALTAITAARSFVLGLGFEDDSKSLLIRSAVERQLEILGEACARLASVDETVLGVAASPEFVAFARRAINEDQRKQPCLCCGISRRDKTKKVAEVG